MQNIWWDSLSKLADKTEKARLDAGFFVEAKSGFEPL